MKTKRVRIAVAMNSDGVWCASGMAGESDKTAILNSRYEVQDVEGDEHALITFIEADIPIPEHHESETVEGEVV